MKDACRVEVPVVVGMFPEWLPEGEADESGLPAIPLAADDNPPYPAVPPILMVVEREGSVFREVLMLPEELLPEDDPAPCVHDAFPDFSKLV